MSDPLRQELLDIFIGRATRRYGLSAINQLQHALQAAALAEADNCKPATVLASLLHAVGDMVHGLGEDPAGRGIDDVHEELGAKWLAERFGPEVSEPVRLHVAAKRYLCATEPGYLGELSAASVQSLELQGGPMSPAEVARFAAEPFAEAAVRLRRWDDLAKRTDLTTPDFAHYLAMIEAVIRR